MSPKGWLQRQQHPPHSRWTRSLLRMILRSSCYLKHMRPLFTVSIEEQAFPPVFSRAGRLKMELF